MSCWGCFQSGSTTISDSTSIRTPTFSFLEASNNSKSKGNSNSRNVLLPNVKWVRWRTVAESRAAYISDETLSNECSLYEVEFRTLLDLPLAYNFFFKVLPENIKLFLKCWLDIQQLKNITMKQDFILRSLHIYMSNIGASVESGGPLSDLCGSRIQEIHHMFASKECSRECVVAAKEKNLEQTFTDVENLMKWLQCTLFGAMYSEYYADFRNSTSYELLRVVLQQGYNTVGIDDFQYFSEIGEGSFGVVLRCRKKTTGKQFAVKIMRKSEMVNKLSGHRKTRTVNDEKDTMELCANHPYILDFAYAFSTTSLVGIATTLCMYGDFRTLLMGIPGHRLGHDCIRFYAAELVSALLFLHENGLMYRDLKPGNVFLHEDGHIRLGDFGAVHDLSGKLLNSAWDETTELLPIFNRYKPLPVAVGVLPDSTQEPMVARSSENSSYSNFFGRPVGGPAPWITATPAPTNSRYSGEKRPDIEINAHRVASAREKEMMDENSRMYSGVCEFSLQARAYSVVGTTGYMAPEMLQQEQDMKAYKLEHNEDDETVSAEDDNQIGNGYTSSVDWWSLGATLYKMYTGGRVHPPTALRSKSTLGRAWNYVVATVQSARGASSTVYAALGGARENDELIQRHESVTYSSKLFPDADTIDFIKSLLAVDPENRIGGRINAAERNELTSHPYFSSIDWTLLEEKRLPPPPIPLPNPKKHAKRIQKLACADVVSHSSILVLTEKPRHFVELMTNLGHATLLGDWGSDISYLRYEDKKRNEFLIWDQVSLSCFHDETSDASAITQITK